MSILNYYDPEINTSGGGSEGTLGPSLVRAPVGTIVVWSGDMDNIPDGWALCDGQDGRPDLRDKFVLGAGGTYNPGAAGTVGSGGDLAYSAQCYIVKVTADATDGLTGEVYSTEEIRIGTWIDGKPLYRKVATFTNLSIGTTQTRTVMGNYSTWGVEQITSLQAIVRTLNWTKNSEWHITRLYNDAAHWVAVSADIVEKDFVFVGQWEYATNFNVTVILEYTKTTDQATIELPAFVEQQDDSAANTNMTESEV